MQVVAAFAIACACAVCACWTAAETHLPIAFFNAASVVDLPFPYFLAKAAASAVFSAVQAFAALAIVVFAAGVFFETHLPNAFDLVALVP